MAIAPRRLSMLLSPVAGVGCSVVGIEDFSYAFGTVLEQQALNELLVRRDHIEQTLIGNETRLTTGELAQFGRQIANALFSGSVQALYNVLGQDTIEVTVAAGNIDTKRVPWEYMVWPDVDQAPHAGRSVARIVSVTNAARHQPRRLKKAKLKVLLIGADVIGGDPIPWDETKANLELIVGNRVNVPETQWRVDLTIVEGATRNQFRTAIEADSYDIIHFIGHGQANGLFLARKNAAVGQLIPKNALNAIMSKAKPALLIMSACNSGSVIPNIEFDSLAESLVETGIPAVVAHQMPINIRAIAEFSAAVYGSLLSDGNIDRAVNEGRMRLAIELGDAESAAIEWGIPVLYRRPGCSQIFSMEK